MCAHCEFVADGFQGVMRVVTMKKKKEVVVRKGRGRGIQCWRSLCSTWIRQSSYGHWRDGIRLHWCPQPLLLGFRFWCWPYTHPHTHTHTLSLLPDFSGITVSDCRIRSPGISYQVKKGQCSEFRVWCFTKNKMHNARSHSIAHVSWFKK